ncbi:MAG: aminopeptidase [Candidatus Odinarchaeia archaeon]
MEVNKKRIINGVKNMFRINMGLKKGENILILTDYPHGTQWSTFSEELLRDMYKRILLARAVYQIVQHEFENDVELIAFPATGVSGKEPPRDIAEKMRAFNIIIALTTFSLTHTKAREKACNAGARVASMPGVTEEMFYEGGPMDVDYRKISEFSNKIISLASKRTEIRVKGLDTWFKCNILGRSFRADTGLYLNLGDWGNLPAGEVFIAPVEGTSEGVLTVLPELFPRLEEKLKIVIEKGVVTKLIGGGSVGNAYRDLLELENKNPSKLAKSRRNIAEFGIGLNPNAKRPDNILEAEKIMGTIHIAIGDNSHFGGRNKSDIHIDFVFPEATVWFDKIKVLVKGKIRVR